VCPNKAVVIKNDDEGFPFPVVDQENCTGCRACIEYCAFQKGYQYTSDTPMVYAVKHKDENVRAASTSGGVFTAISDYVLARSGVVFGAKSDEYHKVAHAAARTSFERDAFRGSKYVKSDLGDCFTQVKDYLSEGILVLFSGTPCQTAALRSYIGEHDNLLTLDFVCHGTPSQLMLDEYIRYVESKRKKKIISHIHRSKQFGWRGHLEANVFTNGMSDCSSFYSQLYKYICYSSLNLILNQSCYNCKYTNFRRPSDITMGDFWGIEGCMPDFDDNKGVSMLLINSNKGREVFSFIKNVVEYRESDMENVAKKQLHLSLPNLPNPKRDAFYNDYFDYGFAYVVEKYVYRGKGIITCIILKIGLHGVVLSLKKNVKILISSFRKRKHPPPHD
jgi:coenzyme F420-reducing hydrogenase beta subunit